LILKSKPLKLLGVGLIGPRSYDSGELSLLGVEYLVGL
jgi:hypothetical protein